MKRILTISAMVIMALGMWAQSVTVTGVVMAQDEPDPVIGANVGKRQHGRYNHGF